MLAAERGAAVNTIEAYRRDLTSFGEFLVHRDKLLRAAEQVRHLPPTSAKRRVPA